MAGKKVETSGDFIAYSDPTNTHQGQLVISLGQGTTRISAVARVFSDASYIQTTGLGNIGRLAKAMGGNSPEFTEDRLVQLSGLDNQWYTLTPTDISDLNEIVPQHIVQGNVSSNDILSMEQLFLKDPFIEIDREIGDERLNGVNTMHLALKINRTKLGLYLQALKDAHPGAIVVTDGDIKAVRENTELDRVRIEVWISRSDKTFQQVKLATPNNDTVQVMFKSEIIATQRQSVIRPTDAQSATKLVKGLHDLVFTK